MAEVPEVETLVRDLQQAVVGRKILETEVLQPSAVRFPAVDEFINRLTNRTVIESQRRAKYILLTLKDDDVLAIHLALWGTVALVPVTQNRLPETLIIWHLDQEQDLHFVDKLGYARAALGPADVLAEQLDLKSLGPEALDPSFSVDVLTRQLSKRREVLKSLLLNQRVLAGLGNRDTDESLWLARIDPRRSAATLTADKLQRLHDSILKMLTEGIELRGTQRDLFGVKGKAVHQRHVFEKRGNRVRGVGRESFIYASVGGTPFSVRIVSVDSCGLRLCAQGDEERSSQSEGSSHIAKAIFIQGGDELL